MINLETDIEKIPKIGPVTLKKLKAVGINNANDLIFYFPTRYDDFSNILPIAKIKINEVCTIEGKIMEITSQKTWKKRMHVTTALVADKSGAINAVWFNRPYLSKTLKKGVNVFLSGKITISKNEAYFSNPSYEITTEDIIQSEKENLTHTGRLVPVYPAAEKISSRWLRYILKPVLLELKNKIPETIPEKIIKENNLLPLPNALWQIHFPSSKEMAQKAQKRFSFDELFFIELFVVRERARLAREKAIAFEMKIELIKKFVNSLSFKLTSAQRKTSFQILRDMEKPRPMNRLLEGDVGSGKTLVAAIAALNVAKSGYQVAFMAPTEILAKQHFNEIQKLLYNFNLDIGLLTGKQDRYYSKKLKNDFIEISRKKMLEKTLKGEIDILIGTHALIQDKVKFLKLALVVLDEQHRFGVNQRAKLCKNQTKSIPHLLSMTATPIPRTLAMTIYGDLDLSLLDEMPKGRKKVITKIITPDKRKETYSFIKNEIKKGRQVFVICPKIESTINEVKKSAWSEVKAVKEEYKKLSEEIFPDLNVEMIHGKIKTSEKEKIMRDMKNKKIDVLVSTSVIEVGIDIQNATVMLIEGSERFGLAQLHQFRGRVGRARFQSYCFLFTTSPDQLNRKRLKALVDSEDGFKLAEKDLEIRGPGSFSGTRQWGIADLVMNSLKDIELVEKTREIAKNILIEDYQLKKYPLLEAKLKKFRQKIHLE